MNNTHTNPLVQICAGLIVIGLAGWYLRIDVNNNYSVGLMISEEIAGALAGAAIGVLALPVAIKVLGPLPILQWGNRGCLTLSIVAALLAHAAKQGDTLSAAVSAQAAYEEAQTEIADARDIYARVKHETATVGSLKELKKGAEAKKAADCAGRKAKSEACATAGAELTALIKRLSDAESRDRALATLEKAKGEAKQGPGKISPWATQLAGPLHMKAADVAGGMNSALTILITIVTVLITSAGAEGIALVISGWQTWRHSREEAREAEAAQQEARNAAAARKNEGTLAKQVAPKRGRKDDVYETLCTTIRESGGKLEIASGNVLADKLGVKRSTMASWLNDWNRAGKLTVSGPAGRKVVRIGTGKPQAVRAAA